jgi:hypothetical protein
MSIENKIIKMFRCDWCNTLVKGTPSQVVDLNFGGTNDVSHTGKITIQTEKSYCSSYATSTLCRTCKIKLLKYAIDYLENISD